MEADRHGRDGGGEGGLMAAALAEARQSAAAGEVPVGAVLVDGASGEILARAHNRVEALADPTAHAELLVIQEATRRLGAKRLTEADLYVTLEPCPMCAAAIALARLRRVYFAAYDPKGGGVDHGPRIFEQKTCNHRPEVIGGLCEAEAAALLRDFFAARR
jgi:tRNA(Arg) A34 adenosine deaminase TadA